MPRKPPPPGYEWHYATPGLMRKLPPRTAGEALWPKLRQSTTSPAPPEQQPRRNEVSVAQAMYPHLRSKGR
jgi:hypothetical protein